MLIPTVIIMDLLAGMEFDLFVPSFPELQSYFNLSPFQVELTLSVNFIGYCIGLLVVGELGDRFGRKPIIGWGLIIFIIGSLICLSANTYDLLLAGRFLQGLGIASPAILSFLIIADAYSLKKQQFLLSLLNGTKNLSVAMAPVVGSYITQIFHWRGNFYTLLSIGVMTLLMTLFFIPTYKPSSKTRMPIAQSYTSIFKSNILILLIIYFILMFIPYWIFVGISPLLYMKDLGVSLSHFGYYQGSLALTFALGSLIFGFMINHFNQRKMLWLGNQIFIISFISLVFISIINTSNPLLITLNFLPFVIGQIIPSNILYPLFLNLMPEAKARLTALIQGGQLLFASLGLQIAGHFYQGSFREIGIIVASIILMDILIMFFIINKWSNIQSFS